MRSNCGYIFFFSSPVWRIIFFFVVQALQLLAVCISNTNSSCSKDSSNISQRNSHGCLFRPRIPVVGLCYKLQFRRKCLSIVYVCVKTNFECFVTTVAITPVAGKWSLSYFSRAWCACLSWNQNAEACFGSRAKNYISLLHSLLLVQKLSNEQNKAETS